MESGRRRNDHQAATMTVKTPSHTGIRIRRKRGTQGSAGSGACPSFPLPPSLPPQFDILQATHDKRRRRRTDSLVKRFPSWCMCCSSLPATAPTTGPEFFCLVPPMAIHSPSHHHHHHPTLYSSCSAYSLPQFSPPPLWAACHTAFPCNPSAHLCLQVNKKRWRWEQGWVNF